MSTILRALQKVETNRSENVQQFGPVHPVKASDTFNKRLTSLWYRQLGKRFLWIGSIAVIILLMIILAIYIFDGSDNKKTLSQLSPTQKSEIKTPSSHMIPSPSSNNQRTQTPGPTRPKALAPKPSHDPNYKPNRFKSGNTGYTPKASAKDTISAPKAQVEPPLETEKILPKEMVDKGPSTKPEDTLPQDSVEPETPVEIVEDDPEELRYAQVDLLENGKLELQAISWSKTPSERIAVINNEIMHQNQSLKGYKIVYIGSDDVVVEKGGEQWKIIFMIR